MSIFVSIPAYRDPECQWTIQDMFAKATDPSRVFVGVCAQYDTEGHEDDNCFEADAGEWKSHVRTAKLHWREARGPCLARNIAQSLYEGQDYQLQIDSHTRFRDGWDTMLIDMLAMCSSDKPVITSYPTGYERGEPLPGEQRPTILRAAKFSAQDGLLRISAKLLKEVQPAPLPSLFWCSGFCFSKGCAIQEVPYDPHLPFLFFGEETSMAARLYTNGWDFFAPTQAVVYHLWTREYRHTFTEDLLKPEVMPQREASQARIRKLLSTGEGATTYGLGSDRTLAQFFEMCDVDFSKQLIGPRGATGGCAEELFEPDWQEADDEPDIEGSAAVANMGLLGCYTGQKNQRALLQLAAILEEYGNKWKSLDNDASGTTIMDDKNQLFAEVRDRLAPDVIVTLGGTYGGYGGQRAVYNLFVETLAQVTGIERGEEKGMVHKSYKRATDLSVLLSKHITKAFREENGLPTLLKASKELWADPDWRPAGFAVMTAQPVVVPLKKPAASTPEATMPEDRVMGLINRTQQHTLEIKASSAVDSGLGVFIKGSAPAGTVMTAYYGVIFDSDDLVAMHQFICPGNGYLLFRRDGVLLDGRPDGQSRQLYEMAMMRQGVPALDSQALPLYACGSLVNHPPSGTQPNVVTVPLDINAESSEELRDFFRSINANFRPPADSDVAIKTIMLVANRDLVDEELWLNYKLSGDTKPTWYSPAEAAP